MPPRYTDIVGRFDGVLLEELQKFFSGCLDALVNSALVFAFVLGDLPDGETARQHQEEALLNARKMRERLTDTDITFLTVIEHLPCKIGSAVFDALIGDSVQRIAVAAFFSVS